MDRDRLIALLGGLESEAAAACRAELTSGAAFEVWEQPVPASRLASIYGRRERLARRRGQVTDGGRETVARPARSGEAPVRLARVSNRDRRFLVFLGDQPGEVPLGRISGVGPVPGDWPRRWSVSSRRPHPNHLPVACDISRAERSRAQNRRFGDLFAVTRPARPLD
ncbi:hypothetical protein Afil01_02750 [Actinorhabdospora filicis]|uniref:Uncharacterized protein n=1 Tax=Actinorhabdospora filicis TaxID=1785913 RepID=A0A9W6SFP7_9ACTN|nr:hypothetical protein [Actinorhabdospora filicis]GLZ75468.1 hypothetical protein Afil01_02750 [Actinorhabdospora filicis]